MCDGMRIIFFNDTATTEIYTLSLHDALPICGEERQGEHGAHGAAQRVPAVHPVQTDPPRARHLEHQGDRKSTRLNSRHANISYAVFCLKKKKKQIVTFLSHLISN